MRGGEWEVYEWLHFKKKKFFFCFEKDGCVQFNGSACLVTREAARFGSALPKLI